MRQTTGRPWRKAGCERVWRLENTCMHAPFQRCQRHSLVLELGVFWHEELQVPLAQQR